MNTNTIQAKGLTKVILEALLDSSPEALAAGEQIDHSLLDQVERQVHDSLAPRNLDRDRLIFDFVFGRAFKEAKDLYMGLYETAPIGRPGLSADTDVRAYA